MAIKKIEDLKAYFETGDKPTQNEFADLIDSFLHRGEEALYLVSITLNEEDNAVLKFSNEETIIVKNSEIQQLWEDLGNGSIGTDKNVGIGISEDSNNSSLTVKTNGDANIQSWLDQNNNEVASINDEGHLAIGSNITTIAGERVFSRNGQNHIFGDTNVVTQLKARDGLLSLLNNGARLNVSLGVGASAYNTSLNSKLEIFNTDPNLDYLRISSSEENSGDILKIDNNGVLISEKDATINGVNIGRGNNDNTILGKGIEPGPYVQESILIGSNTGATSHDNKKIIAIGNHAMSQPSPNGTSDDYIAIGYKAALKSRDGKQSVVIGNDAFSNSAGGSNNVLIGHDAANYYDGDKNTPLLSLHNSVVLGAEASALGNDNDGNEIAIGYKVVGNGSNTVTLGNDDIIKTYLKGSTSIDNPNPEAKLDIVNTDETLDYLRISSSEENGGDIFHVDKSGKLYQKQDALLGRVVTIGSESGIVLNPLTNTINIGNQGFAEKSGANLNIGEGFGNAHLYANGSRRLSTHYGENGNPVGVKVTGDIEATVGAILTSPNGTRYRLTVNDDGSLNTTSI